MTSESIIDHIQDQITDLEVKLYHHPYRAGESDYQMIDGEQVWTEEFLNNMPSDYATMLGRFGTLNEIKVLLDEERLQSLSTSALEDSLTSTHPRFQVELSDE